MHILHNNQNTGDKDWDEMMSYAMTAVRANNGYDTVKQYAVVCFRQEEREKIIGKA